MKPLRLVLILILTCLFLPKRIQANTERNENKATVGEFLNKQIEGIDNATSPSTIQDMLRLHCPPSSISCNRTDSTKIKAIKNVGGSLYLLSANELLSVEVDEANDPRLRFIGTLLKLDAAVLDVQIELWLDLMVIVVQQENSLSVYITSSDSQGSNIDPIQTLSTNSVSDRFILSNNGKDLFLVIYGIKKGGANELMYFKWTSSYFSKESQELIDLPNKSKIFVFKENTSEPLVFAVGISNDTTRIVSLKLNVETNKWSKLHSLYFKKGYIEHYVVNGQLYVIGCSTDAFCAIYKWKRGHFQRHLKITSQVYERIKSVYYQQDIVVVESFQDTLSFFTSDNIVSLQPEFLMAKRVNVADFAIYKSPGGNVFFVEFLVNKTSLTVNFYKISIEKRIEEPNEQLAAAKPSSLECVAMLKSQLKHRMPTVQALQQKVQVFKLQENPLDMEGKKFFHTRTSNLKNSKVRRLTIENQLKSSAKDLQKKTVDANINVELTRRLLKKPPSIQSQARAGEDEIEQMDNIVVEELIHNGKDPLFSGILLKSQPVLTLSDDVKLRNVTANKIVVMSNKINNIEITKLLNTTKSKRVPGSKKVKVLQVKDLTVTDSLNNLPQSVFNSMNDNKPLDLSGGFESEGDVTVTNLVVKAFNGFDVEKLLGSMFLMGEKNEITGPLTLRNVTNVEQLIATSLMDLPVESFMTTSTDQTVKSKLFIDKFFVSKLTTNTVNDEPLAQNVALINGINDIEVPSQFLSIHVLEDLNIRDEVSNAREQRALTKTIENFKRHIIGTQATDLSQIYSGQVILRGSLTVKDIKLLSLKQTKIIVRDQEVAQNISLNYWMKTAKQRIQIERFVIANQAVGIGHLFTRLLASHPIKEYILLDASSQGFCNLRFEKALVKRDVKGHKDNVPSMLFHLNRTAIFRQEPAVFVQGSIDFRGKATIRNLGSAVINSRPTSELVHINQQLIRIEGTKTINDFQVDQLLLKTGLTVGSYNKVGLQKLLVDAIRIDQPLEIDVLNVSRFEASTLSIESFEDHQFNEFIGSLEKQLQLNGTTGTLRNVKIVGDVKFASSLFLNTLNGKTSFEGLISLLVLKSDTSMSVGGRKTFAANLVTENLDTNLINGFSAKRLLYESLGRNEKQTISGEFFVKNLKTKSIRSKIFNKIPLGQFVDKTFAHLPLRVNLNIKDLHVRTLESMSSSFDVSKLIENIQFPKRKSWNSVAVETGAAEIPIHQTSQLDQIVLFAVTKVGPPQIITGKIQTISEKVLVKSILKADGLINANQEFVNMNILFADSVKRQMEPAVVVKGIKSFLAPVYVNNLRIGGNAYFESKEINDEDVLELNRTIVRPNSIIEHEKVMKHLHAEQIELSGKINGIQPESLISVTNNAVQLPRLSLQHLELQTLKTYTFFNYSLPYFLRNRMRMFDGPEQETSGFLIFTNVDLVNNAILSSINQVPIDDLIFSRSDHRQELIGRKYVMGNITLIGPSNIKTINNVDFSDFVGNSVTRHKIHKADVMEIPSAELKKGIVVKQHINGYNTAELLTSDAHVPKLNYLVSLVTQVKNQIKDLETDERVKDRKVKRLIYVDYDPEVQIAFEAPRGVTSRCAENTIEPAKHNLAVVREKRGSEMFVNVSSASFIVTPNFQCRSNNVFSKELDVWWAYNHDKNNTSFRNFSFTDEISDVKIVESKSSAVLMILTMTSSVGNNIVALTLARDDNDWHQTQKMAIGKNDITRSAFIETARNQFLVVSSFNVASASEADFVTIYQLNSVDDKFTEYQRLLTGDKFNIMLSIDVTQKKGKRTFLLLTKEGSRALLIHWHNEASKKFVFQRRIHFDSEIVEVVVLYSDSPYFIVSLQSGDFCMFEWGGVESWKLKNCGHFSNINQIKSYEYLKRQHLFLTTLDSGTALTVHRQG